MDLEAHWEHIYQTKSPVETSWYQPHLEISFDWISAAVKDLSSSIIDVGGGESTLLEDLLAAGYRHLTVLDVAGAAISKFQQRLGSAAQSVHCLKGDVTTVALPAHAYDLWHDRAVFHFLTEPQDRLAYLRQLVSALKPGGQVVMATFGPRGPETCSGLHTKRYDAKSLQHELGPEFHLVRSSVVMHQTPLGRMQQFLYCHFSLKPVQEGSAP